MSSQIEINSALIKYLTTIGYRPDPVIDELVKKLQPLGLASTSRTGVVAMTKGSKIYEQH